MDFVRQFINSNLLNNIILPENLRNKEVEIIVLPLSSDDTNDLKQENEKAKNSGKSVGNENKAAGANNISNFNAAGETKNDGKSAVGAAGGAEDDNSVDSLVGRLNKYSNPALIHTEREAWANAVVDKL